MPDIVTISETNNIVTVYDGRGFKGDPGDSFDQTLNTTDAVEFAGLVNNGLTFPTADGTAGQVIETDGAGVLSFVTPSGVSSLTAGTGISVDVSTGDVTITNDEPDQTVTLTDGTGITITGTYPSFTIDCDITQYTDTDARLALSAGTGISYDDTTGIITNDEPDQTVTLTDGTGITITGTYPSFTVDCDITQYTDTDARLSLSAGTGISYDDTTGIITNDDPDQTVTLTNGTDITITGTYPSFTIAYSGTAGSGTVTKASVVSANGFAGSVATDTTTPAITISTSITGLLKGDGTAISAATAGTDYVVPSGSITGNSATVTTNANLTGVINSTGNTTTINSQTGTGSKFVVDTSPVLVTPTIGVASATTINKVAITAPATGATLTIVEGATLTASATASVSGTNTGDSAINSLYSSLISDKTVVLTAGSGIVISGTYPSFTITNSVSTDPVFHPFLLGGM